MRIVSPGHAAFVAILVALGLQGLLAHEFTAVWAPVPKGVPAREPLLYGCALVSLACGAGMAWRRTAGPAARLLCAVLVAWLVLFRVSVIARAPRELLAWDGAAETAVMVAASGVLCAWFATGGRGLRPARVLFGLAMIPFGLVHLAYVPQTAALVPGWLPAHAAWARFTGVTFLAAGAAIVFGVAAGVAARLAAVQIGLFTLLVWIPIVVSGRADASQWSEFALSCALTAGAWVVADSFGRRG